MQEVRIALNEKCLGFDNSHQSVIQGSKKRYWKFRTHRVVVCCGIQRFLISCRRYAWTIISSTFVMLRRSFFARRISAIKSHQTEIRFIIKVLSTFYMHYTYSIHSRHLAASTQFTASLASCIWLRITTKRCDFLKKTQFKENR